jgi:hypothetical protein
MMTLAEGIRHAEECAKKCDTLAETSVTDEARGDNYLCAEEHRQLAEWLRELQRYQWIPCSERLPSKNGTYIATYEWVGLSGTNYTEVDFIDYERGRWQRNFGTVIAWMPLPKAYEPEEADE